MQLKEIEIRTAILSKSWCRFSISGSLRCLIMWGWIQRHLTFLCLDLPISEAEKTQCSHSMILLCVVFTFLRHEKAAVTRWFSEMCGVFLSYLFYKTRKMLSLIPRIWKSILKQGPILKKIITFLLCARICARSSESREHSLSLRNLKEETDIYTSNHTKYCRYWWQ